MSISGRAERGAPDEVDRSTIPVLDRPVNEEFNPPDRPLTWPVRGPGVVLAVSNTGQKPHGLMGREGFEPSTLGLRVPCSTS